MASEEIRRLTHDRVEAFIKEKGLGPSPRTSVRWMGSRTKGLPYSRMILDRVTPSDTANGKPAVLHLRHPTRGGVVSKPATPALLAVFFPGLAPKLTETMLGIPA